MIDYEILQGIGKNSGKPYTIIKMKFLLKDGQLYEIQKFATKEEATLLRFLASPEQISEFLQETQF